MIGWIKRDCEFEPDTSGWYRVAVEYGKRDEDGEVKAVDVKSEFAYFDNTKKVFRLAGQFQDYELGGDFNEDDNDKRIVAVWMNEEVLYSPPVKQAPDRHSIDDLNIHVEMALEALQKGDYGMAWNMVGREYEAKVDRSWIGNKGVNYVKIVEINLQSGDIKTETRFTLEKPAEFIRLGDKVMEAT